MTIERFRRKPQPGGEEDQVAVRYEPRMDLTDALTVARMADSKAEVTEVTFGSGKRVLLAWYTEIPDGHPPHPEYVTVEPGDWLVFSHGSWSLYDSDEANWRQFYDLAPKPGGDR